MARLDQIEMGRLVHIFTDHMHLLPIYDPQGMANSIARYAVNMLMCWSIRLCALQRESLLPR